MSVLCGYNEVKTIVEEMLAKNYGAMYFSLNDESEDYLKTLFKYYGTNFENIISNDD